MAISFTIQSIPDPNGEEGKTLPHARLYSPGTRDLADLCTLMCSRSTLSPADMKAALDSLAWVLEQSLREGYYVKLDGIGSFSPSLRTTKSDDGRMSVTVDAVNFLCDRGLRKRVQATHLERKYSLEKERSRGKEKDWTQEVLALTRQAGYLSPRLYCALTGCSRYLAEKKLQQYVDDGLLIRKGRGRHTLYLLP